MANVDDLLSQLPMSQIAAMLGVDEDTAANASRAAVPALVHGMKANAQDQARAESLAKAIAQHAKGISDRSAEPDVTAVDTDDGERIVHHVFGDQEDQVVNQLGGIGGGSGLMKKLLPLLAPIVMGFVAKQLTGGRESAAAGQPRAADESSGGLGGLLGGDGGGGIGDLLGGLVGAGGSGGGGLGDMLGGLLGGDNDGSGGGGGLGDMLGGLLGRGT